MIHFAFALCMSTSAFAASDEVEAGVRRALEIYDLAGDPGERSYEFPRSDTFDSIEALDASLSASPAVRTLKGDLDSVEGTIIYASFNPREGPELWDGEPAVRLSLLRSSRHSLSHCEGELLTAYLNVTLDESISKVIQRAKDRTKLRARGLSVFRPRTYGVGPREFFKASVTVNVRRVDRAVFARLVRDLLVRDGKIKKALGI